MSSNRSDKLVFVLAGIFEDEDAACQYTQPQWEAEPDAASDEAYSAWEARNPIHPLAMDLGLHLDEDFVETVPLETEYLGMMLKDPSLAAPALGRAPQGSNFMVLILEDAFDAVPDELPSTDRLAYLGVFASSLSADAPV